MESQKEKKLNKTKLVRTIIIVFLIYILLMVFTTFKVSNTYTGLFTLKELEISEEKVELVIGNFDYPNVNIVLDKDETIDFSKGLTNLNKVKVSEISNHFIVGKEYSFRLNFYRFPWNVLVEEQGIVYLKDHLE
ncbi:hypothetical protein [Alkalihalobacillus trypoxylicola]|uniref:Uncharacterized protein n=1 Tax=Alkalihalobacillus trypoxylicola TaxID=519424 RepID=A0A161Q310_9BACI|nr:hypothetical protein [Alkalihalobacillus trypoxylicola]KYG30047.1 hypothetical protein AZF04_20090 [Alkalihalobacillus trypoxylicola]